ncbi:hypothetical protein EYF80_039317 [Liparis tanakae]|uniref:Uncharacterized protein n=1 Tax=Liparis tanakae TaxID=230148 RepID=A0A4Z2GAA5_9TELE|nr:hypothetical protein EYF80_039317 [Liparis tanakae]
MKEKLKEDEKKMKEKKMKEKMQFAVPSFPSPGFPTQTYPPASRLPLENKAWKRIPGVTGPHRQVFILVFTRWSGGFLSMKGRAEERGEEGAAEEEEKKIRWLPANLARLHAIPLAVGVRSRPAAFLILRQGVPLGYLAPRISLQWSPGVPAAAVPSTRRPSTALGRRESPVSESSSSSSTLVSLRASLEEGRSKTKSSLKTGLGEHFFTWVFFLHTRFFPWYMFTLTYGSVGGQREDKSNTRLNARSISLQRVAERLIVPPDRYGNRQSGSDACWDMRGWLCTQGVCACHWRALHHILIRLLQRGAAVITASLRRRSNQSGPGCREEEEEEEDDLICLRDGSVCTRLGKVASFEDDHGQRVGGGLDTPLRQVDPGQGHEGLSDDLIAGEPIEAQHHELKGQLRHSGERDPVEAEGLVEGGVQSLPQHSGLHAVLLLRQQGQLDVRVGGQRLLVGRSQAMGFLDPREINQSDTNGSQTQDLMFTKKAPLPTKP